MIEWVTTYQIPFNRPRRVAVHYDNRTRCIICVGLGKRPWKEVLARFHGKDKDFWWPGSAPHFGKVDL